MLQPIFNPDLYHGRIPMRNFFEGWYFKLVSSASNRAFAFIPGIFWGANDTQHHAFLQVLDGEKRAYQYVRYPASSFSASKSKPLKIQVGPGNTFDLTEIRLAIDEPGWNVQGTVRLRGLVPWPSSPWAPGSMGQYNFLLGMQCYSQVSAMDVQLEGSLAVNGESIDFDGGRGYIEKNWGSAFPYSWVWVQANNFSKAPTAVSCSIGHIPLRFTSFRGFLMGVQHEDEFYEFTTMNRSRLHIEASQPHVRLEAVNKTHRLVLNTTSAPDSYIQCLGPRDGAMVPLVDETLQGTVELELYDQASGKCLLQDVSPHAGLEYGGDQRRVVDTVKTKT